MGKIASNAEYKLYSNMEKSKVPKPILEALQKYMEAHWACSKELERALEAGRLSYQKNEEMNKYRKEKLGF